MDRSRLALIMPAFNEVGTIAEVVRSASRYGTPIVVSDGSSDGTAAVAEKAGAIVVSHNINKGYDEALNSGFKEACQRKFEFLITLDADGQHDPVLLKKFIVEFESGSDLVLGVRSRRPRLAEHVFAVYTRLRYGIFDPLCGMKGYRRSVYEALGHFDRYRSIGTELALFGVKNKFSVAQVQFIVGDRLDSPRFARLFDANIRIFRSMIVEVLRSLRKQRPY